MVKILAIDYKTTNGHRNFNKIHVDSLVGLGHQVHLVGRKETFSSIDLKKVTASFFPSWTYKKYPFPAFSERIKSFLCLKWIKKQCKLSDYDIIIFLSYEIISIAAFRTNQRVVLINHNTVYQLNNKIKLFLTRSLPKNYIHVALSKDMEAELKRKVQNNVYYIPHGFAAPSNRLEKPVFLNDGEKFLFCGINNNYNNVFVRELFCSPRLSKYLEEKGVKLLVKKKLLNDYKCNHIIALDNNLSNDEYNYLIQKSLAVLLPYAPEFKYRCSGMLFECIAAKTPVIATRIDAMTSFEGKINIEFFDNVDELIRCIDSYCNKELINVDEQLFMPQAYWKKLLEEIL